MRYNLLGSTGLQLSELGFGAAPLGDEYGKLDPNDGIRAVHLAIDRGINFFDSSPYYGRTLSETRLGEALKGRRDEIILCTKCGRYDKAGFDFSGKRIRASIDESLGRLQTDRVDILLAHDIEFTDERQVMEETVPALQEIKQQGKARFIGVSGLPIKLLGRVAVAANLDVVLSYCRYNLLVRDLDQLLAPLARDHGFGLINASPMHMGILTPGGPQAWHPASKEVLEAGRRIADLCQARGADISTVALRFCLDYPKAATTLSGMSNPDQVERNLSALNYDPDPQLIAEIEAIAAPVLNRVWPSGKPENDD